jgi:hypothetical protein
MPPTSGAGAGWKITSIAAGFWTGLRLGRPGCFQRGVAVVAVLLAGFTSAHAATKGRSKPVAACANHVDDDRDGFCDFAGRNAYCSDGSRLGDRDCASKDDDTEACAPVPEVCDQRDNDCDGLVDEGGVCAVPYYCDADRDSYLASTATGVCSTSVCPPAGCATAPGPDCADGNPAVNPGIAENCDADRVDDDCDGLVDECDPCANGVRDGSESDIDCGGTCVDCVSGAACNAASDCLSGLCEANVCVDSPSPLDPSCRAVKYDGTFANHVNLVFVPSGFNGDMAAFTNAVQWISGIFNTYEPFGGNITAYNVVYAPVEGGSYCNFNCNGIARLLCCSTSQARTLSALCTDAPRQTIVVHNSTTYGGAGYTSADVATTSIHSSAPRIAVHELGHSLFDLADEYDYSTSTSAGAPNCAGAGCTRWSDMLGYQGVDCRSNSCAAGAYWASELTLMRSLSYPFEEVNLRQSCCVYRRQTGTLPGYCDQFRAFSYSANLESYCDGTGGAATGAVPSEYLDAPLRLDFVRYPGQSVWTLVGTTAERPGYYARRLVHGDGAGPWRVEIDLAGGSQRVLKISDSEPVEYPGETAGLGGWVRVPREVISVLLDAKSHGQPVAARVVRTIRGK